MKLLSLLLFLMSPFASAASNDCNVKYERYTQFSQDTEAGFKLRVDAVRACASSMLRHLEFRDVLLTMIDHSGNEKKVFYNKGIWSEQKKRFIFIDPFTKKDSDCLAKASILTIDFDKKVMKAPEGLYVDLGSSFSDISCS